MVIFHFSLIFLIMSAPASGSNEDDNDYNKDLRSYFYFYCSLKPVSLFSDCIFERETEKLSKSTSNYDSSSYIKLEERC